MKMAGIVTVAALRLRAIFIAVPPQLPPVPIEVLRVLAYA
jgi:hypothetical protein